MGGFGAEFGQRIAEALAGQDFCIKTFFLLVTAVYAQHFQCIEMVLRDLPERAICLCDQGDDLGQGDVGNPCATVFFRHTDAPQARARKHFQFRVWQTTLAVAQGAVTFEVFGQVAGDDQGLLVAGDNRDVMRICHVFLQRSGQKCSGRQIQE
ncbi:hypothetical protein D3C81_1597860 [compost metagenome]